ncbi:PTI1-like tyrosine-protein kinase At3g15890 isoform X2 [Wolffia australiana]
MPLCPSFCCVNYFERREKGNKRTKTWRIFSLKELHSATNNFNYDNKLGEGAFGSVYWGQLTDGAQVAVKRLKMWYDEAEVEFSVEAEILCRVKHKNLLCLRGYCNEAEERLLVYEYVHDLSLYSHLHGPNSSDNELDWPKRMKIAIGSAEGIAYLHHHASPHIIHGAIKSSNVLLGRDFEAQVADFGLARLIPGGPGHVSGGARGSQGYLPPEYSTSGKASESSDVYSFGILLLELVSGKKPAEKFGNGGDTVAEWGLQLARERNFAAVADPSLEGEFSEKELKRVVLVALACAQNRPEKRPTMAQVLGFLRGDEIEDLERLEKMIMEERKADDSEVGISRDQA